MNTLKLCLISLLAFSLIGCPRAAAQKPKKNSYTPPIGEVKLEALDKQLSEKGKETFALKCSACHKIETRHVGPALLGVTKRRKPAWIMNMILDPEGMIQNDSIAKELLGKFMVPMVKQKVDEKDARAILEYFRLRDSQ